MRAYHDYIIILIVLISNHLHAQQYLQPDILSVENGLSSKQINSLTFDKNGYLWIGTNYGLNRFDGYRFRHFFTAATGDESSASQIINAVKSDPSGNLWIVNQAGINQFDINTGTITRYPAASFDSVFPLEPNFKDIYPGANGVIWILTSKSLTMFTPGKVSRSFSIPEEQLKNNAVPTCLLADVNGNIWIGTTSGLIIFNLRQEVFKELIVQKSQQGLLSDNQVQCLYLDRDNFLWIGTKNGLNRLDPVDFSFTQYYPGGSSDVLPENNIIGQTSDGKGTLILATGSGIMKFNMTSQSFTPVYYSTDTPVTAVAIDSSGNIWGGTSLGILKIRKSRLLVSNYNAQSSKIKLSGNRITALAPGMPDDLYIGYEGGNYDKVNLKTRTTRKYKTLGNGKVINFYSFRKNQLLALTEHDIEVFGPSEDDQRNLHQVYSFIRKELLQQATLNCLFYDGNSNMWVGTSHGFQHIRFDSATHVTRQILNYENQKIDVGQVFDIEQDLSGNLWLGTQNGLLFYDPRKGSFSRFTPYDKNLMNTERKEVYSLVPGTSGIIWIGTSGGPLMFDLRKREFTAIGDYPEVLTMPVTAMAVDLHNNLWIATERGLYNYRQDIDQLMYYDASEGLYSHIYTAISKGNDSSVVLGGEQGLSVITLTDPRPMARVHSVMITGFQFIEKKPSEETIFYQLSDTINLPWNRKPIRIDFAVMDLSRPELNHFRYSFGKAGKDQFWYPIGTQNYILLDHLAPGKYIFSVNGSNADMLWHSEPKNLVIIVKAPFWRSTISLFIYIVFGAFVVFVFVRFWIRQFFNLSRENQEREMYGKQIMEQKEELALKNKSITDSINYAKRIQTAMLPPYKLFKSVFPSSFILFMPKDIVSGDFYWINKLYNKIFIAAVDCTGHGVPGAFMSIIGFELFRKITNIEGLSRPSDILNRLNEDFHVIFKDVENVVLRDGMDVAFCSIDKKDMILEFAGAFNPLYLIRDNKILEIKGDRFAIGLDETNFMDQTFKNHIIPIQKGDIIYIFSDGFADQFGGPDGKKYKYRRFRHLLLTLHQLPMEKQHEILENNVIEWRGEQDQVDDILVIAIKIDF